MNYAEARVKHQRELARAHKAGDKGNFKESERIYRRYIEKFPQDAQVLFNLGVLVQRRADNPAERHEAADFYRRAIESPLCEMSVKSNAMSNFGLIMGKLNEVDKAAICFGLALQMNPANNAARINFADMLRHNGEYEEADREFAEVLKLDPESAPAKFSAGMIALLLGDLKRGFELYESRFETESFPTKRFKSEKPLWMGEDLNGKTILMTSEQGLGDDIMSVRYALELKKKWPDSTVWFLGGPLMTNLFKGADGLDLFTSAVPSPQLYDYHCPTLSFPNRLGTTLETVPNETPYIREHDSWPMFDLPISSGFDGDGIERENPATRIGLCWAGSPRHGKDAWRSLAPEAFQPMIDSLPDCQFYSLQVGPRADECERLHGIIDLAPMITDFTDTAQAILQLDEIACCDTAVAHLAGALGKPVRVLIPFSPDWRWRLATEESEWYPLTKLYRQSKPNDWTETLTRLTNHIGR